MKKLLVFALFAAGFSMSTANAANALYCTDNGYANKGDLRMERESENRYLITDKTINDQGKVINLVTTYIYVLETSKLKSGETNYSGNAEIQVSPDGFDKLNFTMKMSKNEDHATVTISSKSGEVINTYSFACWNPDNR